MRAAKAVDGTHNLEVIGSNPVPATNIKDPSLDERGGFFIGSFLIIFLHLSTENKSIFSHVMLTSRRIDISIVIPSAYYFQLIRQISGKIVANIFVKFKTPKGTVNRLLPPLAKMGAYQAKS